MKLIIAIIRFEYLEAVEAVLTQNRQASLLSISEVIGTSREPGFKEIYRGREVLRRQPKFRLEIAVDPRAVEATLEAVLRAGSRGIVGETVGCRAYVIDMADCVPSP